MHDELPCRTDRRWDNSHEHAHRHQAFECLCSQKTCSAFRTRKDTEDTHTNEHFTTASHHSDAAAFELNRGGLRRAHLIPKSLVKHFEGEMIMSRCLRVRRGDEQTYRGIG